jgi:hypothetical protein
MESKFLSSLKIQRMETRSLIKGLWGVFLVILSLSFCGGFANAQDTTPPTVVSSNPANGATNVSINLAGVSITFSEPMSRSLSYSTDFTIWGAPPGTLSWSSGDTILTFPRDPSVPLPVGVTVRFTIYNLRDVAGNFLAQNPYILSFLVGTSVDLPPSVTSTNPANGTTGVDRNLQTVSITFSEPMNPGILNMTSNFPPFSVSWSDYNRVLHLTRNDTQPPLSQGTNYVFNLNPPGGNVMCDTQGNPLPQTTFSFQTQQEFQLLKIPKDSANGFHWPYYLLIPNNLSSKTVLLVETNNTGYTTDDITVHDAAAESLIRARSDFAIGLDVPILVPTFPRPSNPGHVYTHALDRYSLLTNVSVGGNSIQRIDLQLIAMIADARKRLASTGHVIDKRIFMHGFSASGAFTSRFTLLHPSIVKASAPGSPGGWPTAPVPSWNIPSYGVTTLRYPVGIADVESLGGKPFDLETYKRVPHYIYVGDIDQNDALDTRSFPSNEVTAICSWLDCSPFPWIADRWPKSEQIYDSVDANAQFIVYPRVAHTITPQMFADVQNFFNQKRNPIITNALVGPIDIDGDAKADIAVYHSPSGLWFIKPSSGAAEYYVGYGGTDYKPVPGDYDGDGKTDIAVYHSPSGLWFIKKSSDGTSYYVGYGGPDYKPVPGDYDGDGKTDIAVYHSPSGLWFIKKSSDSTSYYVGYGGSDYKPVSGDYDGDGKTDIAVYHSPSGLWFIRKSSDDTSYYVGYGGSDYKPVPGDYDGDGKTDIAAYHPPSGLWFIKPSSGAADYYVGYGGPDYHPVNLPYLMGWVY